jgi:hypothetical protein
MKSLPLLIGPIAPIVAGGKIQHPKEQAFEHRYDYLRTAAFTAYGLRDAGGASEIDYEMRHLSAGVAKRNGLTLMGSIGWTHPMHYDLIEDGKRPKASAFFLAEEALYAAEYGCQTFTFHGAPRKLANQTTDLQMLGEARDLVREQNKDIELHLAASPFPDWNWHKVPDLLTACKAADLIPDLYAATHHVAGTRDASDWSKILKGFKRESIIYVNGYAALQGIIRAPAGIGAKAKHEKEKHNESAAWAGLVSAAVKGKHSILVEGGRSESSAHSILLLVLDELGIEHDEFFEQRKFVLKHFEPAEKNQRDNARIKPEIRGTDDL